MSHFAQVVNGKVTKVLVIEQEVLIALSSHFVGTWMQTSYNTRGNVHYGPDGRPDGGVALRGNFAGIGYTYDSVHDVFYPPPPYRSWTLNQSTWTWQAPIPYPTGAVMGAYSWNETTQTWVTSQK